MCAKRNVWQQHLAMEDCSIYDFWIKTLHGVYIFQDSVLQLMRVGFT